MIGKGIFLFYLIYFRALNDKDELFYLHSKLLKNLIDITGSPSISHHCILKLVNSLIRHPSSISNDVAQYMISCFSNHFLWIDTYSYLSCISEAFDVILNLNPENLNTKSRFLDILHGVLDSQMIHYSSQKLLEHLTIKVIKLFSLETDRNILDSLGKWLNKSLTSMTQTEIEFCFEVLLQICCGVSVIDESKKFANFWSDHVFKNTKVENIPHPATKAACYTRLEVSEAKCVFGIGCLINMFHQLAQLKNSFSVEVFYWLCHVSSWSAACHIKGRLIALEFVSTLSSTNISQPIYSLDEKKFAICNFSFNYEARTQHGLFIFQQEHFLFSALAILEYETSYIILTKLMNALQQNLSYTDRWYSNGPRVKIAIKLLFDKVTSMIISEWNFSTLVFDIPSSFKKHELFLSIYDIMFVLFQFKSIFLKHQLDLIAPALLFGLSRWPMIARSCMQGLHIYLYEFPRNSIIRHLSAIILKISQLTSSNLAISNLEFLASLASLPSLHANFTNEDYKRIFGIALTYLRQRNSSISTFQFDFAYYVTQVWFLSLKINERIKFVPMIISMLLANSEKQNDSEGLDENVELVRVQKRNLCIGIGHDGSTFIY